MPARRSRSPGPDALEASASDLAPAMAPLRPRWVWPGPASSPHAPAMALLLRPCGLASPGRARSRRRSRPWAPSSPGPLRRGDGRVIRSGSSGWGGWILPSLPWFPDSLNHSLSSPGVAFVGGGEETGELFRFISRPPQASGVASSAVEHSAFNRLVLSSNLRRPILVPTGFSVQIPLRELDLMNRQDPTGLDTRRPNDPLSDPFLYLGTCSTRVQAGETEGF